MATYDTDSTAGGQPLPDEVVADLLAADRRYHALSVLSDRSRPVAVDDLAAAVCARETDVDRESVGADERRAVRRTLFQDHLPKLTATDVVAYDSVLGTVELTDRERVRDALGET